MVNTLLYTNTEQEKVTLTCRSLIQADSTVVVGRQRAIAQSPRAKLRRVRALYR